MLWNKTTCTTKILSGNVFVSEIYLINLTFNTWHKGSFQSSISILVISDAIQWYTIICSYYRLELKNKTSENSIKTIL